MTDLEQAARALLEAWDDPAMPSLLYRKQALRAALAAEAGRVSGWQPIETAPKQEGYHFLVRRQCRNGLTYVMQVSRYKGRIFSCDPDSFVDDEIRDATHWQPLLKPPTDVLAAAQEEL